MLGLQVTNGLSVGKPRGFSCAEADDSPLLKQTNKQFLGKPRGFSSTEADDSPTLKQTNKQTDPKIAEISLGQDLFFFGQDLKILAKKFLGVDAKKLVTLVF